jgi:tetratricopeptide (TPR) repeat protein
VFSLLGQASSSDYKLAGRIAAGRTELAKGNVAAAVEQFDAVIAAPAEGPAEKARQQQARLGKATALVGQNQHDEAAKVLEEVIAQTPVNDTRTLAEAYVRKGDTLLAGGKLKEAVLAYLHVDVLFPAEQALHAEALYHLAELGSALGEAQLTADAAAQLESKYANTEWAKRLSAPAGP